MLLLFVVDVVVWHVLLSFVVAGYSCWVMLFVVVVVCCRCLLWLSFVAVVV